MVVKRVVKSKYLALVKDSYFDDNVVLTEEYVKKYLDKGTIVDVDLEDFYYSNDIREVPYVNVKLSDGTTGWCNAYGLEDL